LAVAAPQGAAAPTAHEGRHEKELAAALNLACMAGGGKDNGADLDADLGAPETEAKAPPPAEAPSPAGAAPSPGASPHGPRRLKRPPPITNEDIARSLRVTSVAID
jgi:hypothetical protein